MDVKEMACESVDWIYRDDERDQLRAHMNAVMKRVRTL
jgi:hypothetical protein